ncbi:hypothetical protein QFZ78_006685 [Paenibacillus sp. V4I5]|nr:hypothetical protein [Paenibacillus sp. V4I5]
MISNQQSLKYRVSWENTCILTLMGFMSVKVSFVIARENLEILKSLVSGEIKKLS